MTEFEYLDTQLNIERNSYMIVMNFQLKSKCKNFQKIAYDDMIPKIVNKSYTQLIFECITGKGV